MRAWRAHAGKLRHRLGVLESVTPLLVSAVAQQGSRERETAISWYSVYLVLAQPHLGRAGPERARTWAIPHELLQLYLHRRLRPVAQDPMGWAPRRSWVGASQQVIASLYSFRVVWRNPVSLSLDQTERGPSALGPKSKLIRSEHFAAFLSNPLKESEFPNERLPPHSPSPPQA